tara:strand:+ start:2408 stop:3193 length:786 start_codon:yes stop_codon:yes gene_type:complete
MKEANKHLYYLNELSDYKVDSHYPDVTGWSVKDRDNRVIGKVENLLVNKKLMKVVYLDVDVDKTIIEANYDPYSRSRHADVREFVNKEGDTHVIIPIGMVHIHEEQKYVHTESIDHQTFAETKRFTSGDNLDRAYEENVLDSYSRSNREHDTIANKKESPYRADRENTTNTNFTTDAEWSEERRKLEEERNKLREERLKLEAERKKLELERTRADNSANRETTFSNDREDHNNNFRSDNLYEDDDRFYERGEFDGDNYRKS